MHKNKATATTSILYAENDKYVVRRNGYNGNFGLILNINKSSVWQERGIQTKWAHAQIKDFTGKSTWTPAT
ncbi:alpha-amylase domain-containing protein [Flavobacterium urumqiense]|uniref:alpha-amylase domain-containing protein n=1 Tax=Flavobacterium urumqiense TaxID=935224 RepID=UPI003CC5DBDF